MLTMLFYTDERGIKRRPTRMTMHTNMTMWRRMYNFQLDIYWCKQLYIYPGQSPVMWHIADIFVLFPRVMWHIANIFVLSFRVMWHTYRSRRGYKTCHFRTTSCSLKTWTAPSMTASSMGVPCYPTYRCCLGETRRKLENRSI